ncbi:MAG: hypothetical protein ACTHOO_03290 [Alcanivorax sp.]
MLTKLSTVFVTASALFIALSDNQSAFSLVLIAWPALGSAFGPLLIVYALKQRVSEPLALTMMVGGIGFPFIFRKIMGALNANND